MDNRFLKRVGLWALFWVPVLTVWIHYVPGSPLAWLHVFIHELGHAITLIWLVPDSIFKIRIWETNGGFAGHAPGLSWGGAMGLMLAGYLFIRYGRAAGFVIGWWQLGYLFYTLFITDHGFSPFQIDWKNADFWPGFWLSATVIMPMVITACIRSLSGGRLLQYRIPQELWRAVREGRGKA